MSRDSVSPHCQIFLYKSTREVDVPFPGLVDDVVAVNKCSKETVILNWTINYFMEINEMKLTEIGIILQL